MPLIVPVLRLAMLFLNIYDTYKFLKPPLPSSRNANNPSLRSITQRKRNMKGCLAVWIVWCCYIVYERLPEPFVSIFIPFHDELKSLVIMFLVLTRARGAEPIYLHIIRPFIKPHAETLDSILDFTFLVLDIALAALGAPMVAGRALWNRIFSRGDSKSEDDEILVEQEQTNEGGPTRDIPHEASGLGSQIPRPTNGIYRANSGGSAHIISPEHDQSASVGTASPELTHKHEIWYPPPSAYRDNEDDNDFPQPEHQRTSTSDSDVTLIQEAQIDEWRQYPKCPAAYPPTPLVAMMHVTAKSNGSPLFDVDEMPVQDFRQSLSPLSEAVDPSSDGDLSDEKLEQRVYAASAQDDMAMFVDTDTESNTMGEEEEDEFNITLQTPLPTRQFANAFLQPVGVSSRITSLARLDSHNQPTTAHNGHLRPKSSLDSLSSAVLSDEESPTIGKKRPLPNFRSNSTKIVAGQGLGMDAKQRGVGDEIKRNRQAPLARSSDNQKHRDDGSKTELKKRKLGSPKRPVRTSRPIRSRLARAVSPPLRPERKPVTERGKPLSQRHVGAGFAPRAKAVASSTNIVANSARNKPQP
ncbi:hypothetical protein M378DRAFT_175651 [Amanita muscaria Koide BX008]|uniref:Protein YOP1 n=1 Tax=Amanita muscaria (strain Koide BX008) TaxID=946122 RepID=A0A0C2T3G3_AMAMK|nr:hypothetical protein M378DRAFT_175651 [Amanita muscaria Koide BX008]